MCKILPQYLANIATNLSISSKTVIFSIKCVCGNENFVLFKNIETADEIKIRQDWENLIREYPNGGFSDSEGNFFLTKKFFGITTKKIKIKKSDIPQYTTIWKCKCANCNKEYILFDSRNYGYDAMVDKLTNHSNNNLIHYKSFFKGVHKIKIKITNDLSFNDFVSIFHNANIDDYSNSYSEISIYIDKNKCIFSSETR